MFTLLGYLFVILKCVRLSKIFLCKNKQSGRGKILFYRTVIWDEMDGAKSYIKRTPHYHQLYNG